MGSFDKLGLISGSGVGSFDILGLTSGSGVDCFGEVGNFGASVGSSDF